MRRRALLRAGAVAGVAALAGCSGSENGDESDWTAFRGGPARSGVRPAASGPGDSPEITWELTQADIAGEFDEMDDPDAVRFGGVPSWPVVVDGVVAWTDGYTAAPQIDSTEASTRVVAADPATGSIRWSKRLSDEVADAAEWFAPTGDDGRLYVPEVVDDEFVLVAFDPSDGTELDRLETGLSFGQLFTITQPVAHDGTIYLTTEDDTGDGTGRLRAFDDDGTEEWSVEAPVSTSAQVSVTVAEGQVWTTQWGESPAFVAYDATDGSETTRVPLTGLPPSIAVAERPAVPAAPTIVDGWLYAAGGLNAFYFNDLAQLLAANVDSTDARWRYRPPGTEQADLINDLGFDIDETALESVLEQHEFEQGYATLYGYPAVVDGLVIATGIGETGEESPGGLFAVDAETGDEEWATPVQQGGFAPVVAGETAYLVTGGGVDVVSTDGSHRRRIELDTPARPELSPALGEGGLFATTTDGVVALR